MACALGLEEQVVGISFECDYPPSIITRPRIVNTVIKTQGMTPREIDAAVAALMRDGKSLYFIDEALLQQLHPDIILTQNLCQVCAPSGNELSHVLAKLDYQPQVIFMSPHSLADIEGNLMELAEATGVKERAEPIIAEWRNRIGTVTSRVAKRPRAFVMEWVDPIYCSGHWLAEMIDLAGGNDKFARKGADSVRIEWKDVLDWQPEVLVVAPCGFNQQQAQAQMPLLERLPGWESLPAVVSGRVHVVDANAYLVRPGPRLIDGLEMLAGFFR
jgi:iron complex transport system substrate-binding protein